MNADPLWLSEADVVALMALPDAIDALESTLRLQARGAAATMAKTHLAWGDGDTLHAVGGVIEAAGLFGTKSWGHTKAGATPLLLLWRTEDGGLAAVIEAFALGQMRTGAISGVATRWLAAPDASTLAVIGSGKQALAQVAAVVAVRPIRRVRVFSPTAAHREAFTAAIRQADLGVAVEPMASAADAVGEAEIVTTVTRATRPFLAAGMLRPGCHVNAVGAITPERAELASDVLAGATVIAADDPSTALRLSRELIEFSALAPTHIERVAPLAASIDRVPTRRADGFTIFKAMGMGLSDVALGARLLAAAGARGIGRPMPAPTRVGPRLVRAATPALLSSEIRS